MACPSQRYLVCCSINPSPRESQGKHYIPSRQSRKVTNSAGVEQGDTSIARVPRSSTRGMTVCTSEDTLALDNLLSSNRFTPITAMHCLLTAILSPSEYMDILYIKCSFTSSCGDGTQLLRIDPMWSGAHPQGNVSIHPHYLRVWMATGGESIFST